MSTELVISMPAELVMSFAAFAVCCDVNFLILNVHNVQFLSMKLSAVNPALEFNIERILSKDVCNLFSDVYRSFRFYFLFLMLIDVSYTVFSVSRNCIVCLWLLTRHWSSIFASAKTFSSFISQLCEPCRCIWKSNRCSGRV